MTKIYDDCSIHFDASDKVGIVGVNGAGKSTLFKVILGQQKLDDGEIELPSLRLGYLPQEIKIDEAHADITVWDYIAMARPVDELQEPNLAPFLTVLTSSKISSIHTMWRILTTSYSKLLRK